jgi:hypothetical protein
MLCFLWVRHAEPVRKLWIKMDPLLRGADALQHNVKPGVTQQAFCRRAACGAFRGNPHGILIWRSIK